MISLAKRGAGLEGKIFDVMRWMVVYEEIDSVIPKIGSARTRSLAL